MLCLNLVGVSLKVMPMNVKHMKINKMAKLKQSNCLVEATYKLTLSEQRLIMAIISQINSNSENFHIMRFNVVELAKFCNFTRFGTYNRMKNLIDQLMSRTLTLHEKDGDYKTHWLQSAKYIDRSGTMICQLDAYLIPHLLQLKSAYLQTNVAPLMTFKKEYSIRLYCILKKMIKVKVFEYKIEHFKDIFALPESYRLRDVKSKILEPALKELNEISDLDISYKYVKEGREYVKINFDIALKSGSVNAANDDISAADEEKGETPRKKTEISQADAVFGEAIQVLYKKMIDPAVWGIKEAVAKKIISKYDEERIKTNILYAEKFSLRKKNLAGWLIHCIDHDEYGNEKQRRQAAAKIEAERRENELAEKEARKKLRAQRQAEENIKREQERVEALRNDSWPWHQYYLGKISVRAARYYLSEKSEEEFLQQEEKYIIDNLRSLAKRELKRDGVLFDDEDFDEAEQTDAENEECSVADAVEEPSLAAVEGFSAIGDVAQRVLKNIAINRNA